MFPAILAALLVSAPTALLTEAFPDDAAADWEGVSTKVASENGASWLEVTATNASGTFMIQAWADQNGRLVACEGYTVMGATYAPLFSNPKCGAPA